ncbi:MAG: hypothetical protein K9M57_02940 [Phycisphaerae bacterium]|nr:hypothetical protein [Phycisphaerae bacterium]
MISLCGRPFTGARISWALGSDHSFFGALGRWHPKLGTPVVALVVQGRLALVIVLLAGIVYSHVTYFTIKTRRVVSFSPRRGVVCNL